MSKDEKIPAAADAELWTDLRRLTAARIGLPRSGASLSTAPLLAFKLAHAQARDAVQAELDTTRLAQDLLNDLAPLGLPVLTLASAAADKQTYLMRPDLGRALTPQSRQTIDTAGNDGPYDLVFVVSDGLSARAVQSHAAPVVSATLEIMKRDNWRLAPLVIVTHGRVAIGDAVAAALRATCVVMLIGERPGLSAPDSMGAYLTYKPGVLTSDADRNCVSNIRPDGIGYADAATKLAHLLEAMRTHGISGVALKDTSDRLQIGGI
jgi:ethanolamine ammonia-lyase small subunit